MLRCNRSHTPDMLATSTSSTPDLLNDSDISLTPSVMENCCCGQPGCPTLQSWTRTVQKLETDARLAAEIGQSLLQKHDRYVLETDKTKKDLQIKTQDYRERIRDLEQAVQTSDAAKQEFHQDKNKWYWKWNRTQSTLDATAADLDTANHRCVQLSDELRKKQRQIERLQSTQIEAREAHAREETLRAKLDDAHQEIATLRKNDKLMQARIRTIKEKHASLTRAYDTLQASVETCNAKTSRLLSQTAGSTRKATASRSSNERQMSWNDLSTLSSELPPPHMLMPSLSMPASPASITPEQQPPSDDDDDGDTSSPIQHHHHYHYILQTKTMNQELAHSSALSDEKRLRQRLTNMRQQHLMDLHDAAKDRLKRLQGTEALQLSRQAKSVFDMPQMGRLSNAMIEHILVDMERQFATNKSNGTVASTGLLYQELLKEIGELRTNLNDLKIDYVKRLKEKYMLQRQQQEAKCLQPQQKQPSIFAGFLSTIFQRPAGDDTALPSPRLRPPRPRHHSRSTSSLSTKAQHPRHQKRRRHPRVGISASAPELDLDMKVRGSLSTSLFVGW